MHPSAPFKSFVWSLVVFFGLSSTPNLELVFPAAAKLFGPYARAATSTTTKTGAITGSPVVTSTTGEISILGTVSLRRTIDQIAPVPGADVAYGISKRDESLLVFDLKTHEIKKEVDLKGVPIALAADPGTGHAWIVVERHSSHHRQRGAIVVVDSAGAVVQNLPVSSRPRGIAIHPAGKVAVITCVDDEKLLALSLETFSPVRETPLSHTPKHIALDLDSTRAVVVVKEHHWDWRHEKLLVVNTETGLVEKTVKLRHEIRDLAVDSEKDLAVAVAEDAIYVIDMNEGAVVSTIPPSMRLRHHKDRFDDPDLDDYCGVDVNSSTHRAVVSGEDGFLLINLEDFTYKAYRPTNVRQMKALGVDTTKNTLVSFYEASRWGRGLVEIQLPNPVPEITSITPVTLARGSAAQTLSVAGKKFIATSGVWLGSAPLPTTFTDNYRLQVMVPVEALGAAQTHAVTVINPAPKGGTSNAASLIVANPVPVLTGLDPASAAAGGTDLTLNVLGSGFFPDTSLFLKGESRLSSFVNSGQMQTTLTAADLKAAGTVDVTASNPSPGGGASNTMIFSVVNPAPTLDSISPASVKAGTGVTLTLTGTNFSTTATVTFNGASVPVTWTDASHLQAVISSAQVKTPGTYPVMVTNPAPGGGSSGAVNLTVTNASNVAALPKGSFGKKYEDLFPSDATIQSYDSKRFAITTGTVKDSAGNPLAGVSVSLHGRAQYGTAQTDPEGRFSLPLDGGGMVTLIYKKAGFIETHRQVKTPWNDIAAAETVVMLPEDTAATTLTFNGNAATILTHQSTPVVDQWGQRSLTMVFSGDNAAYVKDANGVEQPLSTITVRATEYTTPESMPAKLPPTSAFTYCSELSVDGARSVRFAKPVTAYIDNFLGFNVGEIVPVGYYDRDRAVWVASNNGVVVRLLDTNGDGIVDALDNKGDGAAHGVVTGLTDPSRYVPGSTYWMVSVDHFSPWDCNWPWGPPGDAIPPNPEDPAQGDLQLGDDCKDSVGSYCEQRSRTFHEDIAIPGTGMTLHYASNRVRGHKTTITVPASGSTVPAGLDKIIVRVAMAGRVFESVLSPLPKQKAEFFWDGLDYRGQPVTGSVNAEISIGFTYRLVYYSASASFARAWERVGSYATGLRGREDMTIWKYSAMTIQGRGESGIAEGWTLSNHHYLSPWAADVLNKGDGTITTYRGRLIDTIAGSGQGGYGGDGGPATAARLTNPRAMAVDETGNLYIVDTGNNRIRRVDTNGIITTVAGTGNATYGGDGGPATAAHMNGPNDIALDASGNLYIADWGNHRIRKIDTNGIITTVAGNGSGGSSSDGGKATQAVVYYPTGVAVDRMNNLFIAEHGNQRVRKVDSDGIITTVTGGGSTWGVDGIPATQARFNTYRVAADDTGNIYIADYANYRVRKVNASGIISTAAGTGTTSASNEGGLATQAGVQPYAVGVDKIGNLYLVNTGIAHSVRKVNASGIITTVAGTGVQGYGGDGGPATQSKLNNPFGVTVNNTGDILIADMGDHRIRKVTLDALSSYDTNGATLVADTNGQGYVMDAAGLHRSTIDLAGNKTLLTFGYDSESRLVSVTDRFGNTTTIQRDGSGTPLSVTSPDGIVTSLSVGGNQLLSVSYPDGTAYSFGYTGEGLMTDKYDPRGNHFSYSYDANGTVASISDPEGGVWSYSRTIDTAGYATATVSTAEGNTTTHKDKADSTGKTTWIATTPTGEITTVTRSSDTLTETEQSSCGMKTTRAYNLDPTYKNRFLSQSTLLTPAGLSRTSGETRTYQDTDSDKIPDLVTRTLSLNGKNWTLSNNTLTGVMTGTSPVGRAFTVNYDPANLLARNIAIPGLLPTSYAYDARGRITSVASGSRASSIVYDERGNVAQVVTPDQKTLDYTYDDMGRLKTEQRPDGGLVSFDYDGNGNMTSFTTPALVPYAFDYTGVNLRKSLVAPLSGSYLYGYDKERKLKSVTFPSGRAITATYAGGLLSTVVTPEGTTNYTYSCGSFLGAVARGTEGATFTYDGALLKTDTRTGLLNQAISYAYNAEHRVSSATYAGVANAYSYDNDGLLTASGPFTIMRNGGNGLPETITGGAMTLSRTYSGYGEVDGLTHTVNGIAGYGYSLTRDLVGRISQKVETIGGETATYDYAYDAGGRLKEVKKNGSVVESYAYDANGNRILETNTLRGISNRSSTYSYEDHLITTGPVSYQFDTDGFLLRKTSGTAVSTYQYSSRGELLSAVVTAGAITYDHDAAGRRIGKRVNGTLTEKYLWQDSTRLLAVYDASDTLTARFAYADDRVPLTMTKGGVTYYLLYDTIGSLRAVADGTGAIVKRIDYDSFGTIVNDSNPSFTVPIGFAGGLHDRDTNLVRFGARDYDPAIGRWTAKDPIDFAGGDTNLYGYVAGDPVNRVDVSGLLAPPWHFTLSLIAGLNSGMSLSDSLSFAWDSMAVDFASGSQGLSAAATAQHAMSDGRQSSEEAIGATRDFIKNNKKGCVVGGSAKAAHAAQDLATPRHAGQPWTGFGWNWDTVAHIAGDLFPSPATIGQAYRNTMEVLRW